MSASPYKLLAADSKIIRDIVPNIVQSLYYKAFVTDLSKGGFRRVGLILGMAGEFHGCPEKGRAVPQSLAMRGPIPDAGWSLG
jgi:hypothetical protein